MEEWGNGRANAYYEANVPSHVVKPKSGDQVRSVEKYIRDKYEHKRYIAKTVPPRVEREVVEEPVAAARRSSVAKQQVKRPETVFAAPAQVAHAPPPPAAVNLIDFLDDSAATPVSAAPSGFDFNSQGFSGQQQQQQSFQQQQFAPQAQQSNGFSAFDDSPRSHQNNVTSNQVTFAIL